MLDVIVQYLEAISNAPVAWKLSLIFFFMAVESSFIPFPSEVVMIPAGFLASRGELGFASTPILAAVVAVLLGTAGSLAGAYFNYYLARVLGEPFLRKYGKWFFRGAKSVVSPLTTRAYSIVILHLSIYVFNLIGIVSFI
jgi:membrane protein DedA with SNARE-associated domain